MSVSRRDLVRLSALAASALALPALADTRPLEPMRLLILGGTGFIGPHQVRYALARRHHVTIFNRGRQKEAWPGPVEELIGDRSGDLKALEGGDWDVCIDNPTSLPAWVRDAASVLKRWRRKPDSNFSFLSRQFLRAGGAVRGNQMAGPEESFSVPGPLV